MLFPFTIDVREMESGPPFIHVPLFMCFTYWNVATLSSSFQEVIDSFFFFKNGFRKWPAILTMELLATIIGLAKR